jgi:CheY-like chemotaxis protein
MKDSLKGAWRKAYVSVTFRQVGRGKKVPSLPRLSFRFGQAQYSPSLRCYLERVLAIGARPWPSAVAPRAADRPHLSRGGTVCLPPAFAMSTLLSEGQMKNFPFQDLKALIVEDDAILASVFEEMLRDLGCSDVAHASSIDAAFDALEGDRPDFVLLDARLRGVSAEPVAELLRDEGVPVVVTTGYSRDALPPSLTAGALLHKPFKAEALVGRVREARDAAARDPATVGENA